MDKNAERDLAPILLVVRRTCMLSIRTSRVPKLLELCWDRILLLEEEETQNRIVINLRKKIPKNILESLLKISPSYHPLSAWGLRAASNDWAFCSSWKTNHCPKMTNTSVEKLCGMYRKQILLHCSSRTYRPGSDSIMRSIRQLAFNR